MVLAMVVVVTAIVPVSVVVVMTVVMAAATTVRAMGKAGFGHGALPHSGSGPPPC